MTSGLFDASGKLGLIFLGRNSSNFHRGRQRCISDTCRFMCLPLTTLAGTSGPGVRIAGSFIQNDSSAVDLSRINGDLICRSVSLRSAGKLNFRLRVASVQERSLCGRRPVAKNQFPSAESAFPRHSWSVFWLRLSRILLSVCVVRSFEPAERSTSGDAGLENLQGQLVLVRELTYIGVRGRGRGHFRT